MDWPTEPAGPPPHRRARFGFLRELPALIVIAFALAVLIKTFLIQAFFIPSESMLPTLEVGDRVLVNKLAYRFREPLRGEVIVFIAQKDRTPKSFFQRVRSVFTEGLGVTTPAEKDFIKRVIGLPGDTIEVTEKGVYITPPGARRLKLGEPYIYDAGSQGPAQEPFVVPDGSLFVMGDNRANSSDSRSSLGPVKRSDVIGKAFVKIWPPRRVDVMDVPPYPKPQPAPAKKAKRARRARGDAAGRPDPVFVPLVAFACGLAPRRRRRARRPPTARRSLRRRAPAA